MESDVPVGTRVQVIANYSGHEFPIGEIVVRVDEDDECRFDSLDGSDFWYLDPDEYEIVG
jgi:hypothetical protein